MSDHIDGPRSIGDLPADVTDLFAFTSPENPARTVLAMCVFPSRNAVAPRKYPPDPGNFTQVAFNLLV